MSPSKTGAGRLYVTQHGESVRPSRSIYRSGSEPHVPDRSDTGLIHATSSQQPASGPSLRTGHGLGFAADFQWREARSETQRQVDSVSKKVRRSR